MTISMEEAVKWMRTTLLEETPHSALGASSGDRWLNCPASYNAQKGLEDTTSVFAAEGTFAHVFSELLRTFEMPAKDFLGMKIPKCKGYEDFEVDMEMVDNIQGFVDRAGEFGGDAFFEITVDYSRWVDNGEVQGFGTMDDIRMKEAICKVTDLKYGKGKPVFAEENTQQKLYCLGVYEEYGHLYDFEGFIIAIDQPRLDSYTTWEISLEDLLEWAETIVRPAVVETIATDAPFNVGDWCGFCRARTRCATRITLMLDIYKKHKTVATNDDLALILPMFADIKKWMTESDELALSELAKGNKVGDYKMVAGRSSRVWGDEARVVKALKKAKLKVGEMYNKKLIGMGQAEKLLGKTHDIFLDPDVVLKPSGKPTMVPGSDKRESLAINVEEEFS